MSDPVALVVLSLNIIMHIIVLTESYQAYSQLLNTKHTHARTHAHTHTHVHKVPASNPKCESWTLTTTKMPSKLGFDEKSQLVTMVGVRSVHGSCYRQSFVKTLHLWQWVMVAVLVTETLAQNLPRCLTLSLAHSIYIEHTLEKTYSQQVLGVLWTPEMLME